MRVVGLIAAGRRECWGSRTDGQKGTVPNDGAFLFVQSRAVVPLRIDLNADVGESFGAYTMGDDAVLMPLITSANVAAGAHAGDPTVLRRTIRLAKLHGVAVGVHPGYPDLAGFGRRAIEMAPAALEDLILYQIAAVAGVAASEGMALQHVKPHGALYHAAAGDPAVATAIVRAVRAFDPRLLLFAPPESQLATAAQSAGVRVAREGFADRSYEPDGTLSPRQQAGAIITNPEQAAAQALSMVRLSRVETRDGALSIEVDTLCVHSDTPGAAVIAAAVRHRLETSGVSVVPPAAMVPPGARSEGEPTRPVPRP